MQPSSLIFLVIIAIWAAYLLQHWVRRREHLATARSVDRFSDAMRVLERRTLLPESDLSAPQPRSYAVSPARSSRPEVVVKRAQSPAPNVPGYPAAAVRPTRAFHALASISARRVRGLSLLASLTLTIVVAPLAAVSVLVWWAAPIAVAVLLADFAWLRRAAAAERLARRSNASARSANASAVRANRSANRPATAARPRARSAAAPLVQPGQVAASAAARTADVAERTDGDLTDGDLTDGDLTDGDLTDGDLTGWAPVPVPPPTYTLKAKAERPEPVPAAVTGPAASQPSSFDGLVDDGELDGLLDRRRAAGA